MSPLATLFVAVVALYLIECLVLVPEDALVLVEGRRGRWRVARHGFALGALRRRLTLLPPTAPHASVLVLPAWTVSLAPSGFGHRDERGASRSARNEELTRVGADGASVRWPGGAATLSSSRRAHWLARTLDALRATRDGARARAIESAIGELTDIAVARSRADELRSMVRSVRLFGVVLFAHLFVVWPAIVYWLGIGAVWPLILVELLVLEVLICRSYVRARRALAATGPAAGGASVLTLALSPPAAARAAASLGRDLLGDMHPLTAVLTLCREEDARPLATRALREARFGAAGAEHDAAALRTEDEWFEARWTKALEGLVDRTVGLSSIANAPARDGESGSYCPRCWTQYASASGRCEECSGLALLAFAPKS